MRTSRQKQRETETPNAEELMGDYKNYHAELGK